jgi:uncharacterized protein YybS (DUF2232 family)
MAEFGEYVNAVIWLIVAFISFIPLIIFFISYNRIKSQKLLITTVAFTLFSCKALLLGMRLFILDIDDDALWYLDDDFWWSIAAILDVIIISLITLALRKKA